MGDERPVRRRVVSVVEVPPPGGYGDGPVFVRVDKTAAGATWPQPGFDVEINDWELAEDPDHDYVKAHNSHSAFVYARWMGERGMPAAAVTVIRQRQRQTGWGW